jgi:hypothetical protein
LILQWWYLRSISTCKISWLAQNQLDQLLIDKSSKKSLTYIQIFYTHLIKRNNGLNNASWDSDSGNLKCNMLPWGGLRSILTCKISGSAKNELLWLLIHKFSKKRSTQTSIFYAHLIKRNKGWNDQSWCSDGGNCVVWIVIYCLGVVWGLFQPARWVGQPKIN